MEFVLLGTVEARVGGHPVDLGHARQRCTLAALLVDAGLPLPADLLVDRVWGDRAPQRARGTLYSYLSRLRTALAPADGVTIARRSGGYVLTVERDAVDLHRFRDLTARARAADGDERAHELYEQALALWRGEPFAGLDSPWIGATRATLEQERHAAELDRNDVALRRGLHSGLTAHLSARAEEHPLDERLAGQLMLALYRCGRQADALAHYRRTMRRLADALGIDPGPRLRRLHQRILTADPRLHGPAPGPPRAAATARATPVPRQLPAPPALFTGRERELAALDAVLAGRPGGTVPVAAVCGPGGIGKTWLALHWGHRNLDRFPDGQLHVNLRGFDAEAEPVAPAVAVRGFLDALGVDPASVPVDPDARAALYRSLVAGRRLLVVLDDARDAEQVRPLLPGSPGCAVLVTSRNRLTGLVATHGARQVALDTLGDAEARRLLARVLTASRVAAEPEAVAAVVDRCAGLPLALGIAAARAAAQPEFPLALLAEELAEAATRLDALDIGELSGDLRAVFAASLGALPAPAARLFALLGLVPGPDVAADAAASLAAVPPARARALLRDLEAAHLVRRHTPGRYRLHALVRLYAAERAAERTGQERAAALNRLVDHYTHTAHAACRVLQPEHITPETTPGPPAPGCAVTALDDPAAALAWFDAEHAGLLAAQRLALEAGLDARVWQLAWYAALHHWRRGHLHDDLTAWHTALTAARRHGDPRALALTHWRLGHACSQVGRRDEALEHLAQALALFERTGDTVRRAHLHRTLGWAWEQHGDPHRALEHAERALGLYQRLGATTWEARQLNSVGWCLAQLGRFEPARERCERALALFRKGGSGGGEASTLDSLGFIAHSTGQYLTALEHYHEALALFAASGNSYAEADSWLRLGDTHRALGRAGEARHAWERALDLYRAQHRATDARRVQERLEAPGP
ncbi:AfsR/SARP family transcriptional regulator [Streptomyces capparidis]